MICNILAIKSNVWQAASMSKSGMDSKNLVATAMSASGGHALGFVNQEHSPCFWGVWSLYAPSWISLRRKRRNTSETDWIHLPTPTVYVVTVQHKNNILFAQQPLNSVCTLHIFQVPPSLSTQTVYQSMVQQFTSEGNLKLHNPMRHMPGLI